MLDDISSPINDVKRHESNGEDYTGYFVDEDSDFLPRERRDVLRCERKEHSVGRRDVGEKNLRKR